MIWKVGKLSSTVVSDTKVVNTNFPVPLNPSESPDEDIEIYGGYLVCESIGNKQLANLIAAAPELLEACKIGLDCVESEEGSDHSTSDFIRKAIAKAEGVA